MRQNAEVELREPRVRAMTGVTLVLVGFLPVMVITALSPAIPCIALHFASTKHAAVLVPLLVATPGLVVAVLAPFAGYIVDIAGRRRPLLIAIAFYALVGVAPVWLDGIPAIAADRLCVGICEAFTLVSSNALLSDYYNDDQRRAWLTVQSAAFPILAAISLAVSGSLTSLQWNGAFLLYVLALPILGMSMLFCKEPERRVAGFLNVNETAFPMRSMLKIAAVAMFALAMFYVYIIQGSVAYSASGFTSSVEIGRNMAYVTVAVPLGALLFNFLSRRLPGEGLIAVCLAFMGTGMIVIGSAHHLHTLIIGGLLQQVSAGIIISAFILWAASVLPPQHRGRGFGIFNSAAFAAQFISPLAVATARVATGDILTTFTFLGVLTLVGAGAMALVARAPLQTFETREARRVINRYQTAARTGPR